MFNPKGATSLAYMKGEKMIDPQRKRTLTRVNMEDLTFEQEIQAREMARTTGKTFIECAAEVLEGQKNLQDF